MAFVLILVLEIILIFLYNVLLLTLVIWTSYSTAVFMISVLAYRFFSWFRSKRNSVVLLYGISSAALGINAVFSVLFATVLLTDLPPYAVPHVGHENPFFILGGATAILNSGYITSTVLSFMLWWVATVFLLHHYSERARRKTYWIILGLPLVYFVVQFQPIFLDLFSSLLSSQPVLFSTVYTLIFTLSKPVGGILFGIAFWTIARKLDANNPVRNYMMISAFGLVLIFVSDEASALVSAPYPPFGVPTVSFMGLASYLVLVGIYSSAVSVAADSRLRQSIRNYTLRESRLLDSIGMAQMGQEIENKVMVLTEENRERIEEETGIQSSLTEEDIKQYLEQVINEVKKQKAPADKKP
jgi:hypothetical protein